MARPGSCTSTSTYGAPIWAAEVAGEPWCVADLFWETWSETALAADAAGRPGEARALWAHAARAAEGFAAGDPRRAASLNNRALGATDPGPELAAALAAWDAAGPWVATMAVEARGRSSTFHLRLETRHRDAYDANARVLHRRELAAGRAVTTANLGLVARARGDEAAARRLLEEAAAGRRAALGPGEAGALWLTALTEGTGHAAPVPALPWPARRPAEFTDTRRLMGAIYLAAFAWPTGP